MKKNASEQFKNENVTTNKKRVSLEVTHQNDNCREKCRRNDQAGLKSLCDVSRNDSLERFPFAFDRCFDSSRNANQPSKGNKSSESRNFPAVIDTGNSNLI